MVITVPRYIIVCSFSRTFHNLYEITCLETIQEFTQLTLDGGVITAFFDCRLIHSSGESHNEFSFQWTAIEIVVGMAYFRKKNSHNSAFPNFFKC